MISSFGIVSPFARDTSRPGRALLQTSAAIRLGLVFVAWVLLAAPVAAQTLPYIPTTILLPESNTVPLQQNVSTDIAYIFSPRGSSVDLLALNVSSTLRASTFAPKTITSGLSFLKGSKTAFAPTVADNGSLIVYAGDCASSSNSGIWTLDPRADDTDPVWTQETVASTNSQVKTGPGFLGGSLSFSATLSPIMSPATFYVYGGMCPSTSLNTTSDQSRAVYYNQMVKLSHDGSSSSAYTVQALTSKGPPVPEAGFTLTGLVPSISNRSGTVTQQLNQVLLGGHTQSAFVNMSMAAIWSLPEESWAFVDIGEASSGTVTELAIKSVSGSVEPRSGHTAILNAAGDALIIYGGWVGDLHTAASPQLAILEIGAGYGGDGKWQWSIPETQPTGSGLYGHGATLLPGNVMLIYGGYNISTSRSKYRRQTVTSGNTAPMFLNLTSMSWSDVYTNPTFLAAGGTPAVSSASNDDNTKRLGLGLGLGLGLAAVLAALLVYFCYRRRLRSRHSAREDAIRAISQDTNRFLHDDDEMMERDGTYGFGWYSGGHDPYMSGGRSLGYETLRPGRTSMDNNRANQFGPEQFMQIPRKPIATRAARGQYQATPTNDFEGQPGSRGRRPGAIHPIAEADEDGETYNDRDTPSPTKEENRDSAHYSDPFQTPTKERPLSLPPPSRLLSGSPEARAKTTDPDVQDWMTEMDAADALLSSRMATHSAGGGGRHSPVRRNTVKSNRSGYAADDDSRTGSNLSESNHSALSRSGSVRSHHLRTGFGVGAAAAAEGRGGTSSSSSSAPSYNTAKSSFPALQTEGPALLLGRSGNLDEDYEPPGSPSKSKPRRGWLGSLRRVFSGPTPSPSPPGSYRDHSPIRDSYGEASDYDIRLGGLGSIAAGGLLRRKGGREAWRVEQSGEPSEKRAAPADEEDEWDIEKAVENRLVQVLFTVPKERLRVVNGEADLESLEEVVLVDPEKDDDYGDESEGEESAGEKDVFRDEVEMSGSRDPEKMALREEYMVDKGKHRERGFADSGLGTDLGTMSDRHMSPSPGGLLSVHNEKHESGSSSDRLDVERHASLTSDQSEGRILDAEAVKLERPRTRVLAMVDNIESRSRDSSPDRP